MAELKKPASIASNDFKSKKWDELTKGRSFTDADTPTLELLCQWHLVVQQCMDDLDEFGTLIHVDDMGRPHSWPQLNTMKQASAEIRQLNKQLGINDEATPELKRKEPVIHVLQTSRQSRAANKRAPKVG